MTMTTTRGTGLITHDDCLRHDTGPGHPEQIDRLRVILKALDAAEFKDVVRIEAPAATDLQIGRIHPESHIRRILDAVPEGGLPNELAHIDADTVLSTGSDDAALRAAGAVCAAVDAVAQGHMENAFCAVRPPGHHAEPDRAMGFCLFNNIAIGAMQARAVHGFERVAVVDFDVHHGNGTQAAFQSDPAAFYASTHQAPLYPGTGAAHEQGVGNIVNVPIKSLGGSREFRQAMTDKVLPALDQFVPDMVFISAGFDAHTADPLAQLQLVEEDYAWVTGEIRAVAQRHCAGRMVSALEGGYNLDVLGACVAAHVRAMMQ